MRFQSFFMLKTTHPRRLASSMSVSEKVPIFDSGPDHEFDADGLVREAPSKPQIWTEYSDLLFGARTFHWIADNRMEAIGLRIRRERLAV